MSPEISDGVHHRGTARRSRTKGSSSCSSSCSSSNEPERFRNRTELSTFEIPPKAMGGDRDASRQNSLMMHAASAIECAACLDASVAKGFVFLERIQSGKEMLVRIVAIAGLKATGEDAPFYILI